MDGFDNEMARAALQSTSSIRCTSTFRIGSRSRTSTWRTRACSPTACFNRKSTRASWPISTSSPRKPSSTVNIPFGVMWGCEGGPGAKVDTIASNRTFGPMVSPCFDYQTLGDEFDRAGISWRFYAGSYGSDNGGGEWSAYQAVKHIRYGPDWKKKVISPDWRFITDVRAGTACRFHLGYARLQRFRPRELSRRLRALMGCRAGERRRQEQVLEHARRFS